MTGQIKKRELLSTTPGDNMKLKALVFGSLLALIVSCVSVKNESSVIGVYAVTARECSGSAYEKAACEEIALIEIVNGNFYKVEDHEFAFVVWSGNADLNYNARKLDELNVTSSFPFALVIDESPDFVETLIFSDSDSVKYESGKPGSLSVIYFRRASPDVLEKYSKEYPGNN